MNRTVPLILAVALFMENMDSAAITTSLPAIATDIGTSPISLKLALTSYLVALAIFIPTSSWVAERYGAKRVFRAAIAVFILGSIACAYAEALTAFVFARFLQGMGGAMMTPIARLVLVRSTAKKDLMAAIAWLTMPGVIGPLLGPPIGGFITTFLTWHWIFLINVPIGLAGIWLAGRYLPEIPALPPRRFDIVGFLLAATAAAGVVLGLSVVSLPALPPTAGLAAVLCGIGAGVAYIFHARRTPDPILDISLFRNDVFRLTMIGSSIVRIAFGATPFLLPLLFQLVFGLTPFESGLLIVAQAVGALSMKFIATAALRSVGFRSIMIWGVFLGGLTTLAPAWFTGQTHYLMIAAVLLIGGLMRSMVYTCSNALVFAEVDDKDASQATAFAAAAQQMAIAIGVALGAGILEGTSLFTAQPIGQTAFFNAFLATGLLTMVGAVPFFWMRKDAGSTVSGHRLRRPDDDLSA